MTNHVEFRFYEELNDFLPVSRKKVNFSRAFNGNPSVKDTIEAIGVPHTEIDLIIVNGNSVDFNYQLHDGDFVSVYPVFESFDISPICHLRPRPLRETKFISDVHLGKLSRLLRMLGFDCFYRNDLPDDEIVDRALNENRIILTRDRGILKRKSVTHGYWIRANLPEIQANEVLDRFDLHRQINPFSRCLNCNGLIKPVEKEVIINQLPPKVREYCNQFFQCAQCGNIYWQGTHYEKIQEKIKRILEFK